MKMGTDVENCRGPVKVKGPAEFQTAVAATEFGLYNMLLLLISIPATWTVQFESTLISYIVPAAKCDLELDVARKSLLNSMAFLGMVSSGFIWGFLLDTLGRKRIILIGYVIEALLIVGKSFSSNVALLSVLTFFAGSITGGLYIALTTYVLEFHSNEYRGRIQMIFGMMFASANMIIPLLSSAILPLKVSINLIFMEFHAWNLLIIISSVNPIITAIAFYYLPETPKFLMTSGKNEEALRLFRTMYRINTRNSRENYPVEALIEEIEDNKESASSKKSVQEYLKVGWRQIRPLFGRMHGLKLLLVCSVHGTFLMAINALRLYMPQIFQATHEYQVAHNGTTTNLCHILDILRSPSGTEKEIVCTVNLENNFQVYFNSMVIAMVIFIGYAMAGTLINLFGKKRLLTVLGISASIAVSSMYFSTTTTTTLVLSSLYLAATGICFDIFVTIVVVIFPTTLRAMAFSLSLLMGRSLTVLGNMIFPLLVEIGCLPPFVSLGCLMLMAVLLSLLVPNTDNEDMK